MTHEQAGPFDPGRPTAQHPITRRITPRRGSMTTETTPADQLRAAVTLLREAASHATPGPWRTHDTHLNHGGHTATVLTDRPGLNDTELIAWVPTMSHEPWDEARNAWRNAGWMALMDPGVGLALADWLEQEARHRQAVDVGQPMPGGAPALAVARRILGTTEQPETTADKAANLGMTPTDYRRYRHDAAVEQIREAAAGLLAETGQRVMDALGATEQATPRRRCAHTDVLHGQCVLYLDDHDMDCQYEHQRCTCADAGDCFVPDGHYADCPQATPAPVEETK